MKDKGILIYIWIVLIYIIIFLFLSNAETEVVRSKSQNPKPQEPTPAAIITAHRGYSSEYPENTFAAFIAAEEANVGWIELDVRKTKDNQLVVSHDANLSRVFGINKNINYVNYSEIEAIDLNGEYIPLLEDIIKYIKRTKIKLNIEIKDNDIEQQVIDLINKYDFSQQCVISSQNYQIVKNIEQIDSNLITIFTTTRAYSDIINIYPIVDGYSVRYTGIDVATADVIHENNKILYIWTCNTISAIEYANSLGADSIITNEVELAKNVLVAQ